jgi:hypothetical protein
MYTYEIHVCFLSGRASRGQLGIDVIVVVHDFDFVWIDGRVVGFGGWSSASSSNSITGSACPTAFCLERVTRDLEKKDIINYRPLKSSNWV